MNGCEAGIVVVLFSVLSLGIMDWVDLHHISKRLDRIEKSLTVASEKYSDNNDDVYGSKEEKKHTLK